LLQPLPAATVITYPVEEMAQEEGGKHGELPFQDETLHLRALP